VEKIIIAKGQDIECTAVIERDGQVVDLVTVAEIKVDLYQRKDDILASYKLSDGDVFIILAGGGQFGFNVQRQSIENFNSGRLFIQFTIDVINNNFDANVERNKITDVYFGDLIESV
jgi:hypothetical protein